MLRPFVLASALALLAAPALAGPFDGWLTPKGEVGSGATPAQGGDTVSSMVARVQRLEGQNRILTGQVQELQNAMRRMQEDFAKYREDAEYRLQTLEGGGKAPPRPKKTLAPQVDSPPPAGGDTFGAATGPGAPPTTLGTVASAPGAGDMMDGGGPMAGDGLDPGADPNAPGQAPNYQDPPGAAQPGQSSSLAPPGLPGVAVNPGAGDAAPSTQQASLPPSTTEDEYTADYRLIEGRNYEAAELAFRKFLQEHPSDKRVPDATHFIGESLFQRQQYRDAAEQFLVVTQKYASHRRAPSSMLRLGMSLAALGEKEAACATFQEVTRKYPSASAAVKGGVDKEIQKNGC